MAAWQRQAQAFRRQAFQPTPPRRLVWRVRPPRAASTSRTKTSWSCRGEYQSSCATVLMLDCSHSGFSTARDRFYAGQSDVALALAQLIRTSIPATRAERRAVPRLGGRDSRWRNSGRVRVGPYYTNTRRGPGSHAAFSTARKKNLRRIIMMSPTASRRLDATGRTHLPNAFGLDPFHW